jgi:SPP1 gp7 family putative phage head morphogenesis protein
MGGPALPQISQKPELELEPLPPREAMKFFQDKIIMPAKKFYALEAWARARAFTVSYVTKAEVLNDIYNAVDDAISQGTTLQDFRDSLKSIAENRGWTGTTPWHEENVFRTNIQTSYAKGKWDQWETVGDKFYGTYSSIADDRRCEVCEMIAEKMAGKVYSINHPIWNIYYVPQHFQCRDTIILIHKDQVEAMGLEIGDEIPEGMPIPLFANNPALVPYMPDLSKMPEELRAMVERDLNK